MLVIVGANGLTGLETLREAQARGWPVRAIVRDDRDLDRIKGMADVQTLSYADPMVPDALDAVMEGATAVVSCIDPRTSGPGALMYPGEAAQNIVEAAARAGASPIVHVSVMGAFRWSYAALNRAAFYLEGGVRNADAPWTILRFSAYHDELMEGHVNPPDGKTPYPFQDASRYAPLSRRDAAAAILDMLLRIEKPGRAVAIGGPRVYTGPELETLVAPRRQKPAQSGVMGRIQGTTYKALPPGDVSVDLDTSQAVLGRIPSDTFEAWLAQGPPEGRPTSTVYPRGTPPAHPADTGAYGAVLDKAGPELARVVHRQLVEDLARLGKPTQGVTLDFSTATPANRWVKAHEGSVPQASGVRVLDADGAEIHLGSMDVLRDTLAEEFHCWWVGDGIPERVWHGLDAGVRRRLSKDPHFRDDPRVTVFREHNKL